MTGWNSLVTGASTASGVVRLAGTATTGWFGVVGTAAALFPVAAGPGVVCVPVLLLPSSRVVWRTAAGDGSPYRAPMPLLPFLSFAGARVVHPISDAARGLSGSAGSVSAAGVWGCRQCSVFLPVSPPVTSRCTDVWLCQVS